jgi:hypothetical protein
MYKYYNPLTKRFEPLLDNIRTYEGLVLEYRDTPFTIFVVHGHQGDLMNDMLWPVTRLLVRYVWRHMEFLGFRNPFSPAMNTSRTFAVESSIMKWVQATNQVVIAGHTHKRAFARPGEVLYFNDGCCVYNKYITGIEISNGEIMLVKWREKPGINGLPVVVREVIGGPEKIRMYSGKRDTSAE